MNMVETLLGIIVGWNCLFFSHFYWYILDFFFFLSAFVSNTESNEDRDAPKQPALQDSYEYYGKNKLNHIMTQLNHSSWLQACYPSFRLVSVGKAD